MYLLLIIHCDSFYICIHIYTHLYKYILLIGQLMCIYKYMHIYLYTGIVTCYNHNRRYKHNLISTCSTPFLSIVLFLLLGYLGKVFSIELKVSWLSWKWRFLFVSYNLHTKRTFNLFWATKYFTHCMWESEVFYILFGFTYFIWTWFQTL